MNNTVDNNTKGQKILYHHRNLNEINSHRKINCRFKIGKKSQFRRGFFLLILNNTFLKKYGNSLKCQNYKDDVLLI